MNAELIYEREDLFQNVVLDLAWLIHEEIDLDPKIVSWEAQEEAIDFVIENGIEPAMDVLVQNGFGGGVS